VTEWTLEHDEEEVEVESEQQLRDILLSLPADKEPCVLLEHFSGDYMTVAANGLVVAIVFQPNSRHKVGLSASMDPRFHANPDKEGDWYEFLVGGTPTPVPKDRCIPQEIAIEVVVHFFRHRALLDKVAWRSD